MANLDGPSMIRKKALKIQERLGMRVGVAYGTSQTPVVKSLADTLQALELLYQSGLKAFVLPGQLFSEIEDTQSLYKDFYGELLKIRTLAQKYNIELSIHNDSFSDDPEKIDLTLKILGSIAGIIDCRTLILHPTFYKMVPQDQALKLVVHKITEIINTSNMKTKIGFEPTGKINELGSLEDVIEITKRAPKTEPIINFAHIHARGAGALRTEADFRNIINEVRASIGQQWLHNAYLMFSGVTYGPSGLKNYVPSQRSDLKLIYLIKTIMSFGMKGTLIFEDPNREETITQILKEFGDMVR